MIKTLPFPHQTDKPLSKFSTLGIGGPARYFAEATSIEEMRKMVNYAYQIGLGVHILGKGSNSLFDDRGFNGLVILNRICFLEQQKNKVSVGSGYSFARLGMKMAKKGWGGLEFAMGIPGTVGGAVYMNAGANGQETADLLKQVGYVTEVGELVFFQKKDLQFSYRFSSFQKCKGAIVETVFDLISSQEAKHQKRKILNYRLMTQPYRVRSAGCAFRNPEGGSAGYLIDQIGLKGMSIGGAVVSEKHGNFILNADHATAVDVLELIKEIKKRVYSEKGILLEEEICYIPYDIQS
ncbi:MAG: UDP-N-acetylmuramate dehydrogenase [Chlamydiales bacterium]